MNITHDLEEGKFINNDCLEILPKIEDKSIDMIFVDLPYGTTQCKWDSIIPLDILWKEYERIIKDNGAMVFTASQPFTSNLIMSNPKLYRYNWIWEKSKATGYLNSKKMPLKAHEDICIFYKKLPTYNPQMTIGEPYNKGTALRNTEVYREQKITTVKNDSGLRYPRTVQYFKTPESEGKTFHPTQKPLLLVEYFIKTYSNEGDLVLDNTAGSFTTALACENLNRRWIAIEKEEKYCLGALERFK